MKKDNFQCFRESSLITLVLLLRRTTESAPTTSTKNYCCNHYSYCHRYRIAARTSNAPDTSTGHLGFRTVVAS